jgi:SH3-like domain-containing protein
VLDAVPQVAPRVLRDPPGARLPRLLSLTEPMRNVTDGVVNLRAGPGTDHAVAGTLDPGEGGPIRLCDAAERWCLIEGPRGLGWVKMTLVGERRLSVVALTDGPPRPRPNRP